MSIRTYEHFEAQAFIPFFQSIASEVSERRSALRRLEAQIATALPGSNESAQLQADRANHRKEMRLALKEVTRLGCTVAREFPLQVNIPGPNGPLDGYSWSAGQTVVEVAIAESAA